MTDRKSMPGGSADQSQDYLHLAGMLDGLLDRLEGLQISCSPGQPRSPHALELSSLSVEDDLNRSGLSAPVQAALHHAFDKAQDELASFVHAKWETIVGEWKGDSPEDNFNAVARTYQSLHQRYAERLKAQFSGALARHRSTLQQTASRKDTRFNTRVKRLLEDYFEFKPCPSTAEKKKLAEITGLELKQVSTWFANQRSRKGRVIRKLNKKEHTVSGGDDKKQQQRTRPQPILEEPEPDLILGGERLDATGHEDGAGADVYGLEGVAGNPYGRVSPVPSLSSSLGSSSNNDSSNSSLFQMPFEVPTPIVHVPQEDPALFQAPPLDLSQEQYKQSTAPPSTATTFVTPDDLPQLFPGIDAQPVSMTSSYFATAPQLAYSSSAESDVIPTATLAKDPFVFSEPDLSSTMNMGEDYWDNILQSISEDGNDSPADEQQPQANDLDESHSLMDLRAVDYAKQQPMLREQNQACDWSTWAMPVLEGFEAQLESQQPYIQH